MLKVLSPYYRLKRPTNMCQMATSSTVFRAFSAVLRGASPSSIESAGEPEERTHDYNFNMKAFMVLDKLMAGLGHSDRDLAQATDVKVLAVATMAA